MEGRKFSSSRRVVIYVRDFLERYDADALRYFIAVAGPETNDTDFTWAEFLRRNNDELVAGWGNLVNRSISMAAKNFGAIPPAGDADRRGRGAARRSREAGFAHGRRADRAAPAEGRRSARRCGSSPRPTSTSPTRRRGSSRTTTTSRGWARPARRAAGGQRLQHAAHAVPAALRAEGPRAARRHRRARADAGDRGGRRPGRRARLPGAHRRLHRSARVGVGAARGRPRRWPPPKPVFRKLDPSIVDEELARLARLSSRCVLATRAARPGAPESAPPPPEPLAVPVLDSHSHLDMHGRATVGATRRSARGRPRSASTGWSRSASTSPSSRWAPSWPREHEPVLAAVALHPNEAPRLRRSGRGAARDRGAGRRSRRCAAVGETGLDTSAPATTAGRAQEVSFRAHIAIAKRHGKALVIHDRDAHADVLRVLDEEGAPETRGLALLLRRRRVGRRVRAPRVSAQLRRARSPSRTRPTCARRPRSTPPDQLLVETDAPFLTPMPYRGAPNASYLIPLTVRALASATGRDVDDLCAAISANGERVFGPWTVVVVPSFVRRHIPRSGDATPRSRCGPRRSVADRRPPPACGEGPQERQADEIESQLRRDDAAHLLGPAVFIGQRTPIHPVSLPKPVHRSRSRRRAPGRPRGPVCRPGRRRSARGRARPPAAARSARLTRSAGRRACAPRAASCGPAASARSADVSRRRPGWGRRRRRLGCRSGTESARGPFRQDSRCGAPPRRRCRRPSGWRRHQAGPSSSCVGLRYAPEWTWRIARSNSPAKSGTPGAGGLRGDHDVVGEEPVLPGGDDVRVPSRETPSTAVPVRTGSSNRAAYAWR